MALLTSKRGVLGWALYDFASSAFSCIITTFIFATYFIKGVAVNEIVGTAQWGHALTIAGIIIGFTSPIFGAIADYAGPRKPWLAVFAAICIVATFSLWFVKPHPNYVSLALISFILATIGFEVATVFYNAMMKDLVEPKYLGRLSGWAWGLGYAGGLIALTIALTAFVSSKGSWLGLNSAAAEHIRISGPLTAIWYLIFALPLFIFTPDKATFHVDIRESIRQGFKTLFNTFRALKKHREIFKFLLASMLYMDGLNTIFAFGGIYAVGTFGMSYDQVIIFGIAMNISAGLGALIFAWLDDYHGSKFTILISVLGLIITGIIILIVHSVILFWIFALTLGLFVGPTQAASRTFISRIAPKTLMTEMFGLYAFSGKITSFLGPFLLSTTTLAFSSQRAGMSTIIILLAIGALLLISVRGNNIAE